MPNCKVSPVPLSDPDMSGVEVHHLSTLDLHPGTQINPFSLRFADSTLENSFRDYYHKKYHRSICNSVLLATSIWLIFIGNDIIKNEVGERMKFFEIVIVRLAMTVVGLVLWFLLSQRIIQDYMWYSLLLGIGIYGFGTAQILFGIWEDSTLDPSFSVITIILPAMTPTFFRQRFTFSFFLNSILNVTFVLMAVTFDGKSKDLGLTATGIILSNILFSYHAYKREVIIRQNYLHRCELECDATKSRNLLQRMLPDSIIQQIKSGADFIYDKYESMSVLFSHVHDFDGHTSRLSARSVLALLNDLFSMFDDLIEPFNVYKVETIGDVYLLSCGCPAENKIPDHCGELCIVALQIQNAMVRFRQVGEEPISLRIGINSGTTIAGVVGMKYPRFRLMGDTVNTASRMSTTCNNGQIQLSDASHSLLDQKKFKCTNNGIKPVKGKGLMQTWLLVAYDSRGNFHVDEQKQISSGAGLPVGVDIALEGMVVQDSAIPILPSDLTSTQAQKYVTTDIKEHIKQVAAKLQEDIPADVPVFCTPISTNHASQVKEKKSSLIDKLVLSAKIGAHQKARARFSNAALEVRKVEVDIESIYDSNIANLDIFVDRDTHTWYWRLLDFFNMKQYTELQFRIPSIEQAYQKDLLVRFWAPNISWVNICTLLGLALSAYDTLNELEFRDRIENGWSVRLAFLVVGFSFYLFTYDDRNWTLFKRKYWKEITVLAYILEGTLFLGIQLAIESILKAYGIAAMVIMLSIICMFTHLPFDRCIIVCFWLCTSFVVMASIHSSSFPGVSALIAAVAIMFISAAFDSEVYIRKDFVTELKRREEAQLTGNLLDFMFPPVLVQELKAVSFGQIVAHEIQDADVLFCDIVGFTRLSASMPAVNVVAVLNVVFATFDQLTTLHSVYKVETIGDAYVACSGVVFKRTTHSLALVCCALDMQKQTKYFRTPGGKPIVVRIGIHTGPVTAGVVGRKMPRYHLFGETVTLAESTEAGCIPGEVAISENTRLNLERLAQLKAFELKELPQKPLKQGHNTTSNIARYIIRRKVDTKLDEVITIQASGLTRTSTQPGESHLETQESIQHVVDRYAKDIETNNKKQSVPTIQVPAFKDDGIHAIAQEISDALQEPTSMNEATEQLSEALGKSESKPSELRKTNLEDAPISLIDLLPDEFNSPLPLIGIDTNIQNQNDENRDDNDDTTKQTSFHLPVSQFQEDLEESITNGDSPYMPPSNM